MLPKVTNSKFPLPSIDLSVIHAYSIQKGIEDSLSVDLIPVHVDPSIGSLAPAAGCARRCAQPPCPIKIFVEVTRSHSQAPLLS